MFLKPYAFGGKVNKKEDARFWQVLLLPAKKWKVKVDGKETKCLGQSAFPASDPLPLTLFYFSGNAKTTDFGCVLDTGPGKHEIEVWNDTKGKQIWIDNILGV
eukprot:TRINITY_DN415_c0_g1_i1.p1 TRINITY_DN415_c0_g1~~TRINITY_DN415_c0_g1_i1.p1  ORF type:complete len:103 (-),score=12.29 TRINITY_DN415_c0_g1_i1:107-415(-)